MNPAIQHFLDRLWSGFVGLNVFDPWNHRAEDDAGLDGVARRRAHLSAHLSHPNPRLLIVGEAPGFKGCRISGVPFTSEQLLLDHAVPRIHCDAARLSTSRLTLKEQSATIMWGALYQAGLAEDTILWNAFPWHPWDPRKGMLSNRTPSDEERAAGEALLASLVDALPRDIVIAAAGRVAQTSLLRLGREAVLLRHPANGGAGELRRGVLALRERLALPA